MATRTANSLALYDEMVRVTYDYLGPAADRFVSRQIENHLRKRPSELRKGDLKELITWSRLAMSVLVADEDIVNQYVANLRAISKVKS